MRVESFVLDEDSLELYGEDVIVEWIDWIRGDKAFESAEALVEQMKIDVENARRALSLT
jgi:riboflavin kinase/FMN adenylyltransferase